MGVPPEIWGPNLWGTLHLLCITGTITPEFVKEFANSIPCAMCAGHFQDILKENPFPESRDPVDLFEWSVYLHNLVNDRIGKPLMTADQALTRWTTKPAVPSVPQIDFKIVLIFVLLLALIFMFFRK